MKMLTNRISTIFKLSRCSRIKPVYSGILGQSGHYRQEVTALVMSLWVSQQMATTDRWSLTESDHYMRGLTAYKYKHLVFAW